MVRQTESGLRHGLIIGGVGLAAGLVPTALATVAAGRRYANRRPGPQLGRLADWSESLLGVAVVPLVAAVTGLFTFVRGLCG